MSAVIRGDFLKEAREFFEKMPETAEQAAMMALNQVADRQAVPMIRRTAESQVAFPSGYLDAQDRLGVTRKATKGSLEVVITARDRPTSLARFAPGQTPSTSRKGGVTVQVKRGHAKHLKGAFLVRLKNDNLGLAVRLKTGTPDKAYKPVVLSSDKNGTVYLLYGPSVDQVVRTVAETALPEIGDKVANEFYRQFARITRGR